MKNFASGKGLQFFLLLALAWTPSLLATVDRQLWYFGQLGAMPDPLAEAVPRHRVGLSIVNYRDALSFETSALLDAGVVDVLLRGSQRSFLSLDSDGTNLQALLSNQKQSLYFEMARFYRTRQSMYGRISVGGARFFPQSLQWLKLGMDTGVLPTLEIPWSLAMHFAFFPSLSHQNDIISASVEVAHQLSQGPSRFELGLGTAWGYRMGSSSNDPGESLSEHMLFTLGPLIKWKSILGRFRCQLLFRVLLDQTTDVLEDGSVATVYPSEIGIPDLNASWSLSF